MTNTAFDQTFRDRNGEIVIAQIPNPPLILWMVATCTHPNSANIGQRIPLLSLSARPCLTQQHNQQLLG
ncbi:MAG: hypothetical protein ACM37W_23060 [Actinomycetota bacterium]